MQESPGAQSYLARFIPPHATQSVPADPFIYSYSDPILQDVAGSWSLKKHTLGAWAALALNSTPEKGGKHAYMGRAKGEFYYIDAWSGEVVEKRQHSGA